MKYIHCNRIFHAFSLTILIPLLHGCANDASEVSGPDESPELLIAAEQGDLPTLTRLIENEAVVDVKDACLWTPLMKAALNGHLAAARRLIQAGADVNQTDKGGYSSLMLAASNDHPDMLGLLLDSGADIDQVETTRGWTALIWAAKLGHKDSVRRLLRYPVNREITDFNGKRAVDWARENRFQAIVSLLSNDTRHPE
ncbi:MAG: ankyrin repeat domain-containing protein [Candidatus Thiodiazotropha sp.]